MNTALKQLLLLGRGNNGSSSRTTTITTFTQSLGAELVVNGNMENGAVSPDNWAVGSSAVLTNSTDVPPGGATKSLSVAHGGTNVPFASQVLALSVGDLIEISGWVKNIDSIPGGVISVNNSNFIIFTNTTTAWQQGTSIYRAASTGTVLYLPASATLAQSALFDLISEKKITKNAAQVMPVDDTITFSFIVPASPIAGQPIAISYRGSGAAPELNNCWLAYLRRNSGNTAWDFRLDSIVSGTATNRINVTGVGTPDAIRVVTLGDTHNCYTGVAGVYTQRAGTITNSTFNTATGLNTLYSSPTTPVSLVF